MNAVPKKLIVYYLLLMIILEDVYAEQNNTKERQFNISRGITLHITNDKANIIIKMSSLIARNDVTERSTERLKFKNGGILQRIGMSMMMVPVLIQLMSLPGALASIKMTLLRSILVGKLALAVMLFNAIRNSQKSEVVLVHKPEYHEHYYHTYHQPDDDDEGWLGR